MTASSRTSRTRWAGSRARAAGPSCPARPARTSWAASPRKPCPCCPAWPRGTPSAISGFPPCRPRRMPNRAFACAGTSQGHMDDKTHTFTSPSIFGLLDAHGISWAIYGYDAQPLTKATFTDISGAAASHFGVFTDFTAAAAAGTLARSRSWSPAGARPATASTRTTTWPWASSSSTTCTRRSGAVPDGPRRCWSSPTTSTAAATTTWPRRRRDPAGPRRGRVRVRLHPVRGAGPGGAGLAADRAGHRVPGPGRGAPRWTTRPILKTVEQRWGLPSLTARDAAAPGFGDVLTLTAPRTDDALAGVTVPVAAGPGPAAGQPSHLQEIQAELVSRQFPAGVSPAPAEDRARPGHRRRAVQLHPRQRLAARGRSRRAGRIVSNGFTGPPGRRPPSGSPARRRSAGRRRAAGAGTASPACAFAPGPRARWR